jgi:SAM-dependent methyltransferase
MKCRLCHSDAGRYVPVREMMFATGESFEYFECASCGCVQLAAWPADMSRYYPAEYHSFAEPSSRVGAWRSAFRRRRNIAVFTGRDLLGGVLAAVHPYPIGGAADWFRRAAVSPAARVLDVGCGAGLLLRDLAGAGFTNLTGVDPFIAADIDLSPAGRIRKGTLADISGEFDLIMLHHSLEHIPEQRATLARIFERLAPGGWCLIRVPVASSWAWQHYDADWVQLDAPRHYFLHSVGSLRALGEAVGLELDAVVHDSTELQFIGSELYRTNRPLSALDSTYSRAERRKFRARARQLNAEGRGDQAAFYFRRPAAPL